MKRLPAVLGRLLVFVVTASAGAAAVRAEPRDVDVQASLERTAVWVADRVVYTITLACRSGVDILADDLSKDKLRVEGLEILGSDSRRTTDRDGNVIYTFSYDLTTYRVDVSELTIAPLTVRYYARRAGQRIGDTAPAGEVQVPAAVIAFRSVLPDGQETYAIRDNRGTPARGPGYAWLPALGIGLVLISIVPAAVAVGAVLRRTRPREKPQSARQVRENERASLEAVQALDISTPAVRRDAYSRLNALVRDHVRHVAGIDAGSLTPVEIDGALARVDRTDRAARRLPAELVNAILAACEKARYAPPDALPSIEACRATIEQAEQVIAGPA